VDADVPDYPPGARGPEENVSGRRLSMTCDQIRFIGEFVTEVDGASSVDVEERGPNWFEVTVFGKEGQEIAKRTVFPVGNWL
jgi:hypothetical protein